MVLDLPENRQLIELKAQGDHGGKKAAVYFDGESVVGKINITLKRAGQKLEHNGIRVEFIGQIEMFYDRGNHHEFTALVKDLARPGDLTENCVFPFEFSHVEKPYETYCGSNVKLRYFVRVIISRRLTDVVKEEDILVHSIAAYPEVNNGIKMEVGIEESLHIEFEYNKSKYHLKDVIVGKIHFLLVRVKIKYMELSIMRKEITGYGPGSWDTTETVISKFEIMDGAPVRGESIPIRLFLGAYPDLTPSMRDVQKKFNVRYFLNLVLVDEEDRRYYKQQEIMLWRKGEKIRHKSLGGAASARQQQQSAAMQQWHGSREPPQTATRKARNEISDAFGQANVEPKKAENNQAEEEQTVAESSSVSTKNFPSTNDAPSVNENASEPECTEQRVSEDSEKLEISNETTIVSNDEANLEKTDMKSINDATSKPRAVPQNIFGDDEDEEEFD